MLRPATSDDVDRLVAWHAEPEIARYWDDEVFTRDEMEKRLARRHVEPWIIEAEGVPVGYLQVADGGLDMFLVPSARGRGLGPDAVRAMARFVLEERGGTRVVLDTYAWNERALHAWRKAGFVERARWPADATHTAEWLSMEYRGSRRGALDGRVAWTRGRGAESDRPLTRPGRER